MPYPPPAPRYNREQRILPSKHMLFRHHLPARPDRSQASSPPDFQKDPRESWNLLRRPGFRNAPPHTYNRYHPSLPHQVHIIQNHNVSHKPPHGMSSRSGPPPGPTRLRNCARNTCPSQYHGSRTRTLSSPHCIQTLSALHPEHAPTAAYMDWLL